MLRTPDWLRTRGPKKVLSAVCRALVAVYYVYAACKFYHVILVYTGEPVIAMLVGALVALVMALAAFGVLACPLHPYTSGLILWVMKLPAAYLYAQTLNVQHPIICACILLAGDVAATLLAMSLPGMDGAGGQEKRTPPKTYRDDPAKPEQRDVSKQREVAPLDVAAMAPTQPIAVPVGHSGRGAKKKGPRVEQSPRRAAGKQTSADHGSAKNRKTGA